MNLRPQPRKISQTDSVDWDSFKEWLLKEYVPSTAKSRYRYSRKYGRWLADGDLSELHLMTDAKRNHVMKSLSALSKFLGVHGYFLALIRNYGLKWSRRNSDDLIINRLTKAMDPDGIFNWIRDVKQKIPALSDFMATTGLRYNESINAYNLIVDLNGENRLGEYYTCDGEVLEHFRFKETFLRRGKKAFISFISEELVETIGGKVPVGWNAVQLKVKRKLGRQRFSDIRELHGTMLTKNLR